MSAAILREAAELIRSRANAAYDWTVDDGNHLAIPFLKWDVENPPTRYYQQRYETTAYDDSTTVFMGSWHPAVALAVADLLENEASSWDAANREEFPTLHYNAARAGLLRDIANAYLGSQ